MTGSWPLFDLRLRHRGLLLRPCTEADLPQLAALLPEDVELDPSLPQERARAVHHGYWRALGSWTVDGWVLNLVVERDGQLVGAQALEAADFPLLRTVDSSSWLVASARDQGVGKAMRSAVLELAFAHLGALAAVTSAWHDNAASLGVSRALGYRPNGVHLHRRGSQADLMTHLRLPRDGWPGADVEVSGFQACRHLFGV